MHALQVAVAARYNLRIFVTFVVAINVGWVVRCEVSICKARHKTNGKGVSVLCKRQKIKGNENPELTRKGFARSEVLADSLGYLIEGIIYSSEFARSQQTVSPLSERWNADIKIHRASDPDGQVEKALQHCGKIVIISGHSNTVPTLINLFGIKDEITIDDNQYGDLFMISWENSLPILTVTHVGD